MKSAGFDKAVVKEKLENSKLKQRPDNHQEEAKEGNFEGDFEVSMCKECAQKEAETNDNPLQIQDQTRRLMPKNWQQWEASLMETEDGKLGQVGNPEWTGKDSRI